LARITLKENFRPGFADLTVNGQHLRLVKGEPQEIDFSTALSFYGSEMLDVKFGASEKTLFSEITDGQLAMICRATGVDADRKSVTQHFFPPKKTSVKKPTVKPKTAKK